MDLSYFLLYFLFSLILLCSLLVISVTNPVHSILFLVLVFLYWGLLLLFLDVKFLAMLFLIVYVGAIAVLFLFVVMMLNVKIIELNESLLSYLILGFLLIFILLFEFILGLIQVFGNIFRDIMEYNYTYWILNVEDLGNIKVFALFLYNYNIYWLLLAGLILLLSIISCILLTLNHSLSNKRQDYYIQVSRRLRDSVSLLNKK